MKILAIDTATERCSVALRIGDESVIRAVDTPRGHADLILPMVESVLNEAGLTLSALDAIAYGRGPGAFTGVRIAIGVVQGLAFGAEVTTVGISDLAAVAQQVAVPNARILVCMDARMQEVYWSRFEVQDDGLVRSVAAERVDRPEDVSADAATHCAGTGFLAYPALGARVGGAVVVGNVLPHAHEIARLAEPELRAGRGQPAADAQPTYLRDKVAIVKPV